MHITGNTTIGDKNVFYPFSSIGAAPQDLKFKNEKSYLIIGNNNTFRENVTINPGTKGGAILKGFSFAMIIGVIVGTYSSIFVATPILNYTNVSQKTILKEDKENN